MNPLRYIVQQEPLPPGSMRQEMGEQHDEEMDESGACATIGGKSCQMAQEDTGDPRIVDHER